MTMLSRKIITKLRGFLSKQKLPLAENITKESQNEFIKLKKPVPFRYKNETFYIAPDSSALEHIVRSTPKIERLASLIPKTSKTIFDVGAHSGIFSRLAQIRCPNSRIFAFEPNTDLLDTLKANQQYNTVIENCAVGSQPGLITLFISPASTQTSSILRHVVEPFTRGEGLYPRTVSVISLDSYCKQNNIIHIDVLKIDVQGFENEVLKGAEVGLNNVSLLLIEASFLDFESVKLIDQLYSVFPFAYAINDVYLGADIALSRNPILNTNKYIMQLW